MRSRASAAVVVGLAGVAAAFPPGVRAVRLGAPAGGDGLSWGTAYNDLQVALAAARLDPSVTELWIAAGTYYVGPVGSPPNTSFRAEHISLYGGFNGTEEFREQRAPSVNISALSGDVNRDGLLNTGDCGPVLTVVTATPVEVDGVQVIGGYAVSQTPVASIDLTGPATFRGCNVRGRSESGYLVARLNSGGTPTRFIGCDIGGSGLFVTVVQSSGGVVFQNCRIAVFNQAIGRALAGTGGAVFEGCDVEAGGDEGPALDYDSVWARDTRFSLQSKPFEGDNVWRGGSADLARCSIEFVRTGKGVELTGLLRMDACRVTGSTQFVSNFSASRVEASNCLFSGGYTDNHYAYIRMTSGWLRGCTVTGFYTSSRPGIELLSPDATISNSIIRRDANFGTAISVPAGVTGLVNNSCVRGWDAALGGVGNFDADPLLDSAGRLMAGSPCIDAGSNALVGAGVTHDFEGRCRVVDGDGNGAAVVDIGASEYTTCAADCDCATGGPLLTVGDLMCFINRFGAGDPWANCDGSTGAPALNVLDFNCYLNRFAAGCP
jgi:hypothetical protein